MMPTNGEIATSGEFGSNLKIGVIRSRFNEPVTEKLRDGAMFELEKHGVKNVKLVEVPGALEIPLIAKTMFEKGFDGVVAVGAVIRGETTHYESVCQGFDRGLMDVQLQYGRPIGNGVITTENAEQAYARAGGTKGNKGAEAASVVLEVLEKMREIK